MNVGDWQISDIGGEMPFLLYQIGEDCLFHYKGSLSTETEVQSFVCSRGLILAEIIRTCPGLTRNYIKVGERDAQAALYVEVEQYRR